MVDTDASTTYEGLPVEAKDVSEAEKQTPQTQQIWQPTLQEKLIIYTLAATSLIVSLDASIIVTPLNAIVTDLGATSMQGFWIGTSYLLVNAVTMPFICSLSDLFGRPVCLTFALIVFTIGTIFCATANGISLMLVGRSIQGVGGAGIHSLGLVILTDIVPLRYRPKWYGFTLAAWAIGLLIGPLIGGAIAQNTTWRWVFYVMFPFLGIALVAVPCLLTLKPKKSTFREKWEKIDWTGAVLFIASATSFLMAVSWGGVQYAWDSYQTLVPLILGLAGLIATLAFEHYVAKRPFLPSTVFTNRHAITAYVLASAHGLMLYSYLYYVAFYFLSVKGYTFIQAGAALLPVLISLGASSIVTGRLVSRLNNFRWPIAFGWFFSIAGSGMTVAWGWNDSAPVWALSMIVIGVGQGAVLNAQNFASQAMCQPGEESSAAAMYAFTRQFGAALGVGIGGTTFQNVMKLKLKWEGLPLEIAENAEAYVSKAAELTDAAVKQAIRDAYRFGFVGIFYVYLGLSVVALILCLLLLKNFDLNKELQSNHSLAGSRFALPSDPNKEKPVESSNSSTLYGESRSHSRLSLGQKGAAGDAHLQVAALNAHSRSPSQLSPERNQILQGQ
ncbi:major facilitator superfamily transporter [Xylariomycetidae sp. FL2044]|nr:major facilitator superfamily transporter [Xylariomycetidae sp. FL2044]